MAACHDDGVIPPDPAAARQAATDLRGWFAEHIPDSWGVEEAEIVADSDELLVILAINSGPEGPGAAISALRESTRDERMELARRAEAMFGRKVSWGARTEGMMVAFTSASVPVMTRLHLRERRVLDTLIDAGVARSRSEALAWCVRLVGDNERTWIAELREAFTHVEAVRDAGPRSRRPRET